jgi:hemerythrin-like domain-containing protein
VAHKLDEEHLANLELLHKVEQVFGRTNRSGESNEPELSGLVTKLALHLEDEIARHFSFEERELFPRLDAAGEGDLAALLLEEHVAIREVAAEIILYARAVSSGTLDKAGWAALRRSALEIVERLSAHIQKETMALLPMLDDLLDEETDSELSFSYASA